jgi:hypothetical protein
LENNGFAQAGTTEQTSLTTPNERSEQVDNLDPGFEDFGVGRKFRDRRSLTVNRPLCIGLDITSLINWLTEHIEDPSQGAFSHWNRNWASCIDAIETSHEPIGATEGNATHLATSEVLLDFSSQVDFNPFFAAGNLHRVVNRWQVILGELRIEGRTDDLTDFTDPSGSGDAHDLLWLIAYVRMSN